MFFSRLLLFCRLYLAADGSVGFGQAIRLLFLTGELSESQMVNLDSKNYAKWRKVNEKPVKDYLKLVKL